MMQMLVASNKYKYEEVGEDLHVEGFLGPTAADRATSIKLGSRRFPS